MNSLKIKILFGMAIFILSCNDNYDTGPNNSGNTMNNPPPPDEVWMENNSFVPQQRSATVGTTITWVNKEGTSHTIISDDGLFNATVKSGGTFSYNFDSSGTYTYYCSIHANMKGTIVVNEDAANNGGY